MKENVQLKLLGITYNQIESGVYALILEDVEERRRLPIVIGYPEAQSIECHLQKVKTPRPLAHDLLATMLNALDSTLLRVDIHRLPSGPYAGKLTIRNLIGEIKEIDARSSDAIALAIRVGAPIYTTRELMEKKGYSPNSNSAKVSPGSKAVKQISDQWGKYSDKQLQDMLEKYVREEQYETAALIKQELEKRNRIK